MTFSRQNALGWTDDFSTITAAQINGLDVNVTRALDGYAGGYYTPTAELAIGGSGLHIWDGSLLIGDGAGQVGELDVKDGSGASWRSGSTLAQYAGATWTLGGNVYVSGAGADSNGGAGCHVVSGGVFYVDNGATVKVRSGGTLQVFGDFIASSGSTVRLYDETRQYSGEFILNNAVPMTLHGDVTIKSDGTLETESGSTVEIGGSIDTNGVLTVNGSMVQVGPMTRTATTATIPLRVGTAPDANATLAATVDVYHANVSNSRTYKILDATEDGTPLRIVNNAPLPTNAEITLVRADNTKICGIYEPVGYFNPPGQFADLVFTGGQWELNGGSGVRS